jgi:hypothetical protein
VRIGHHYRTKRDRFHIVDDRIHVAEEEGESLVDITIDPLTNYQRWPNPKKSRLRGSFVHNDANHHNGGARYSGPSSLSLSRKRSANSHVLPICHLKGTNSILSANIESPLNY